MKRLVLILSFAVLALVSYGQEVVQTEVAQSCIVRKGDRYTVNGITYINSTEFRGYLKNTNPDLFAQYNKGYKLGMAVGIWYSHRLNKRTLDAYTSGNTHAAFTSNDWRACNDSRNIVIGCRLLQDAQVRRCV